MIGAVSSCGNGRELVLVMLDCRLLRLFRHKVGCTIHRLVLVGEDIDVYDSKDTIFAFSARCRPETDELFYQGRLGIPLVPYMSHRSRSPTTGEKVVSDALLPFEYKTSRN
jgi:UbiD family decarboxylase